MTEQQAKWAAQHDWFRESFGLDDVYQVICYDSETDKNVTFNDFETLYVWAGY